MSTKKIWDNWEEYAIKYLEKNWYEIIWTNFKFSIIWEIDIIAKFENEIIFVEVKYRNWNRNWTAEESITFSKRQKILKTIQYYCLINSISEEDIRFDIIAINNFEKKIYHYKRQSLQ